MKLPTLHPLYQGLPSYPYFSSAPILGPLIIKLPAHDVFETVEDVEGNSVYIRRKIYSPSGISTWHPSGARARSVPDVSVYHSHIAVTG